MTEALVCEYRLISLDYEIIIIELIIMADIFIAGRD